MASRPENFGIFETFEYKMWKLTSLSDTAIRVLEVILLHMDFKDRISFPTQDLICKESGIMTVATVSRAIKELVTKQVISVTKRKGEFRHYPYNCYKVCVYKDNKLLPPAKVKKEEQEEQPIKLLSKEEVDDIIRRNILVPEQESDRVEI